MDEADPNKRRLTRGEAVALLSRPLVGVFSTLSVSGWIHSVPAVYARRKVIVEPVFGQMATLQNGKHLLLRGLHGARGEWLLLAACHNLRKLHGKIGTHGLATLATS